MTTYEKPHLSIDQQIDLLESRGLVVPDREEARHYLGTVGYYAMGSYWYPARRVVDEGSGSRPADTFVDGASFSDAAALYLFDQKLRLIALEALERVERALKVSVAYTLGKRDLFAHRDAVFMHRGFVTDRYWNHARWVADLDGKVKRKGHQHIKAVHDRYNGKLPIWIAIEVMDFGDISRLIWGMSEEHAEPVAEALNLYTVKALVSWSRAMNHLRNLCAHHQRLWNRELTVQPSAARGPLRAFFAQIDGEERLWQRPYAALLVLAYLHEQVVPGSAWPQVLGAHLQRLPVSPGVNHGEMGAPDAWHAHPAWGLTA
ncbi:MAG: Abi family protein [Actinomycetota bacterium]|nr:Abi family protein [Actinomycetota bacterium]